MFPGYVKVAAAVPEVRVADCGYNLARIKELAESAMADGVEAVVFPELCLTAYTCQDLLRHPLLLEAAQRALEELLSFSQGKSIILIVGIPVARNGALLNGAAVMQNGHILGFALKSYLPNYNEFYEKRWFTPASDFPEREISLCGATVPCGADLLFHAPSFTFAVELCEDLWAPVPPACRLSLAGADIIFNLSADNELVGKDAYLQQLLASQSARCLSGYVYASCGPGESTQDLVFSGKGMVWENGILLCRREGLSRKDTLAVAHIDIDHLRYQRRLNTTFSSCRAKEISPDSFRTLEVAETHNERDARFSREVNPTPFIPEKGRMEDVCESIVTIQTSGLAKRLSHTSCRHLTVGISGGLDSTLSLLVAVRAFDCLSLPREGITGVTMPGFGTTGRTHNNALELMRLLGVSVREISIEKACMQHFHDIGHDPLLHDVTYENSQARERTQILMDIANQTGGMVLGTGDLSELALGWATYNGDHMSMYNVNVSIPKTLVQHLVRWFARTARSEAERAVLEDILSTPISPELLPADKSGGIAQKTEDLVGPYELHDFFLYHHLRCGFPPRKIFFLAQKAWGGTDGKYSDEEIARWLTVFCRRFFSQQFKRSCLPDGPKVGSCSLSPRGDWRMSSDTSATLWKEECEKLLTE